MQWFLAVGDGDSAVRMGSAIWPLLFTLALATDVQDAMEAALGSAGGLSDDNRANARLVLGMMALDRGDYDRAVAALRPAFERYDESGDERGAASASVGLGFIATPAARARARAGSTKPSTRSAILTAGGG